VRELSNHGRYLPHSLDDAITIMFAVASVAAIRSQR